MRTELTIAGRRADALIFALAGRQHGVVARRQLLDAGASRHVVDRRIVLGLLRPMHSGVYAVGPVLAPRAVEMAAALACGGPSAVSHESAGFVYGIGAGAVRPGVPSVIDPGGGRRVAGVRVHRIRTLRRDEVTRIEGIPITTVERTLYDLAATLDRRHLERVLAESLARRLTRPARLERMIARHAGRAGSRILRSLVRAGRPLLTRSEAEERFLALIRSAQLPDPESNVKVAGHEVDFLWRSEGLVVEIDGSAYDTSPSAFERDRARDAVLAARGVRVVRVTWRQLVEAPVAVAARTAQALATTLADARL